MSNPNNNVAIGGVVPDPSPLPGDLELLVPWLNVARRARQMAAAVGGPALVKITLVTDEYGNPVPPWCAPEVTRLEPRATAEEAFGELMKLLSPGA